MFNVFVMLQVSVLQSQGMSNNDRSFLQLCDEVKIKFLESLLQALSLYVFLQYKDIWAQVDLKSILEDFYTFPF